MSPQKNKVYNIIHNKIYIFFAICFLQSISANLVHPITPTFIIGLSLPSYIFGVAFSCMAATNFLFSSFWGKLVDLIGHRKIILIGCLGYAFGQFLFSISTTVLHIVLARLFSGIFVGAIVVSQLTFTIHISSSENKSRNLTILSVLLSVSAAIGYLIGGIVGTISIEFCFLLQIFFLSLSGILFFLTSNKSKETSISLSNVLKLFLKSTPIDSFKTIRKNISPTLFVLILLVFLSTFSTVDHDQTFNFYIKGVYNFSSAYNGVIKAVVAIIALVFNFTICSYIVKKLDISKSLVKLFLLMTINASMIFLVNNIKLFLILNVIYYGLNVIYVPLLQYLFSNSSDKIGTGVLMGQYNSVRSLGMIFGALFAGFIYDFSPKSPFISSGILFLICSILLFYSIRKNTEKN